MNKIQKLALTKLKENKNGFEREKQTTLSKLLEDLEIKKAYSNYNSLIIELSKQETANKSLETALEKAKKHLEKLFLENSADFAHFNKTHLCDLCKDIGFVNGKPCACLKQIMSNELTKESGIVFDDTLLQNTNFDIFEDKEKTQKIYTTLTTWAKKMHTSKIRNWGFFGNTGTGKTHLMLYLAKTLIDQGTFIYFTTAFAMTQELLKQHTDFEDKNRDYLSKYLECEVLFIDDLGTETIYSNVNENYLYLILNQRIVENKPIIFSTNFDINGFEDFYGERIFSRLLNKRNSKAIFFDGNDLRLKK